MRCKTNAHLQITHSIRQRRYVDWKYGLLKQYVLTPPKSYKGNGKRVGYRFFTRSLEVFTECFIRFYIDGTKIIPKELELDPVSLAVWFMDDGSKSRRSCYLNTQQFSDEDQTCLITALNQGFGLRPRLDRDKQYKRMRFSVGDTRRLIRVIGPYVLPSMYYKFPI